MKMLKYDAVIVGSGPNGLTAGIELAQHGMKVLIVEGADTLGGGMRTAELTLPGFIHDFCSAVHPTGVLSPYWQKLPLTQFGLEWVFPPASVAHPLDNQPAVILTKSMEETMDSIGIDGKRWEAMLNPFLKNPQGLLEDGLKPLGIPNNPILLARFGMKAMLPATTLSRLLFKEERARALFAGCAAHSILPLDKPFSAAIGLMFATMGHVVNWPVAKGGSAAIARALGEYFLSLGGEIQMGFMVKSLEELPAHKVVLFDTDPHQLSTIAENVLPERYVRRLRKYHYGPATFKIDYALNESIPWRDKRCLTASTVHVGGPIEAINYSEKSAWKGIHVEKPFVMVCQQSEFDTTRAPMGKQTGYAYSHVPHDSDKDMTEAIENQIERFAPGFKEIILERHITSPKNFMHYNPNYVGGAITGGAADITQLFTRPIARLDPYSTPNPALFICSASTPPGGGVHGMCGFYAAKSALKRLKKR